MLLAAFAFSVGLRLLKVRPRQGNDNADKWETHRHFSFFSGSLSVARIRLKLQKSSAQLHHNIINTLPFLTTTSFCLFPCIVAHNFSESTHKRVPNDIKFTHISESEPLFGAARFLPTDLVTLPVVSKNELERREQKKLLDELINIYIKVLPIARG